ncbi:cysteine hydrolase family protein [Paraburkholderia silvatlantica]|uniref:Nicotinamidase-related amidase n=1 Tax=Paraburkholderia silvatlantica TaxID=321895 RepID=A0A2U1A6G1_9BURK|nr:isochorismatase family cysteine hydrolase [Paraburkholderia silvatlantica]MBB2927964.1 nicotinamidase-related amidase [Paraburkholderia silvatlantica]PVY27474.1 nicotinamidase-related amidase [Paraburkholderia silvatlantica]PXW34447.1 nicotinamidase-related amidase [Paraburkholderia silvatlantica]PYE15703.1 nicotinamidase-related amidase [Paraburkholderia silvatlantica]TDQ89386.1 nicotinamidase-related amidase [Paraburkholderia silvatlantica]
MIVRATPYNFPITGSLDPQLTALVVIDMQRDFCDPLGYMGTRGGDVTATMAIVPRIQQVRDCAAAAGLTIIHTREGHRPDLSDLPENKRLKTARAGAEIGSRGPLGRLLVRGESGWEFIPELEPRPGEIVIDKPGTGAFYGTDLHHVLATSGIQNLVLVGVTTGVCVTSTAREASDRGLNVLVISDCCAEPDPLEHEMAIRLLQIEGGYIATIASTVDFVASVNTLAQS